MEILDAQAFWDSVPTEESPAWPGICLDFNGVFDQYEGYNGEWIDYPPADGIEDFLIALRKHYNTVVVLTATMPLELVMGWLNKHHLSQYIDYVTNHKPPAHCYVDDRAVRHRGNFDHTFIEAVSLVPHWKVNMDGKDGKGEVKKCAMCGTLHESGHYWCWECFAEHGWNKYADWLETTLAKREWAHAETMEEANIEVVTLEDLLEEERKRAKQMQEALRYFASLGEKDLLDWETLESLPKLAKAALGEL